MVLTDADALSWNLINIATANIVAVLEWKAKRLISGRRDDTVPGAVPPKFVSRDV